MIADTTEILTKILELKQQISANGASEVNKLYIVIATSIGTLLGVTISALLNLWKDNILFKKNMLKEEKMLMYKRNEEENDLTRKLVARSFGVYNQLSGAYYAFAHSLIENFTYTRLAAIETNANRNSVFTNLAITHQDKLAENKEKIFMLLREFSEIIGEYSYLNPQTDIVQRYNEFKNAEPKVIADFSKMITFDEVQTYRLELIEKYNHVIEKTTDPAGLNIVNCMQSESAHKFNSK